MTSRTLKQQFLLLLLLLLAAGCSSEEEGQIELPGNGALVRIDVSTVPIDGWQTATASNTRIFNDNETSYWCTADEKTHLIMSVLTEREKDEPSAYTRANLAKEILFRVVAYRCTAKEKITTANYAGHGEYKITNASGIAEATKELVLQAGTYTFVCYSQGTADLPTFTSSTLAQSVANGIDFMTTIKENVTITRYVSTYTLSEINFTHRCARIALNVTGITDKMANITACQATLTLPKDTATYSFTNNTFTTSGNPDTTTVAWTSPNALTVTSPYVCVLPQTSANIPLKLTMTIGERIFSDVKIAIPNQALTSGTGYVSTITLDFKGYIVAGSLWAPGNLVGTTFYSTSESSSGTPLGGDYWNWNTLDFRNYTIATPTWSDSRDPCKQVAPANYWRTPTGAELEALISTTSIQKVQNGVNGRLYANVLFLPMAGYRPRGYDPPQVIAFNERGIYWSSTERGSGSGFMLDFSLSSLAMNVARSNEGINIRCVKD